ncbi:hypothetical protein [Shewanella aestuarii]|uniref:Uncharacterized protein n=1 Tax=Shewanella aestuarii TaxID=1028752 RepID=A0A6G9QQ37_9GAMM|nr:hypothetical protein [Shewanella aestuarii]QIR16676.1 hypothetical protein HBH39_19580 [Shewanella aestuarii]
MSTFNDWDIKALKSDAVLANQVVLSSVLIAIEENAYSTWLDEIFELVREECHFFDLDKKHSPQEAFAFTIESANQYNSVLSNFAPIDFEAILDKINTYYQEDSYEEDEDEEYYYEPLSTEQLISQFVYLIIHCENSNEVLDNIGITEEYQEFKSLLDFINRDMECRKIATIEHDEINNYKITLTSGSTFTVDSLEVEGDNITLSTGCAVIEDIYISINEPILSNISMLCPSVLKIADFEEMDLNKIMSQSPDELFREYLFPTVELKHYIKALISHLEDSNKMVLQSNGWLFGEIQSLIASDTTLKLFCENIHDEAVDKIFELVATTFSIDESQKYLKAQILSLNEKVLKPEFNTLLYYCNEVAFINQSQAVSQQVKDFVIENGLPLASNQMQWEQMPLQIEDQNHVLSL